MKTKIYFLFLTILLASVFVSGYGYNNPTLPKIESVSVAGSSSSGNGTVNNYYNITGLQSTATDNQLVYQYNSTSLASISNSFYQSAYFNGKNAIVLNDTALWSRPQIYSGLILDNGVLVVYDKFLADLGIQIYSTNDGSGNMKISPFSYGDTLFFENVNIDSDSNATFDCITLADGNPFCAKSAGGNISGACGLGEVCYGLGNEIISGIPESYYNYLLHILYFENVKVIIGNGTGNGWTFQTNGDLSGTGNLTAPNICYSNGTNCMSSGTYNSTYNNILNQDCPTGKVVNGTYANGTFKCTAVSGKNPFDQSLNTTDSVIFSYAESVDGLLSLTDITAYGNLLVSGIATFNDLVYTNKIAPRLGDILQLGDLAAPLYILVGINVDKPAAALHVVPKTITMTDYPAPDCGAEQIDGTGYSYMAMSGDKSYNIYPIRNLSEVRVYGIPTLGVSFTELVSPDPYDIYMYCSPNGGSPNEYLVYDITNNLSHYVDMSPGYYQDDATGWTAGLPNTSFTTYTTTNAGQFDGNVVVNGNGKFTRNVNVTENLYVTGNLSVKRAFYYGYDNSTQTNPSTANANILNISNNGDNLKYGMSVVNRQNLTFQSTGIYICDLSPEFFQNGGSAQAIAFWVQKNGVDVKWSNSRYTLGNNQYYAPTIPFAFEIRTPATDNIRFMWYSDSTSTIIYSSGALTSPTRPSVPGIILNCRKSSEII